MIDQSFGFDLTTVNDKTLKLEIVPSQTTMDVVDQPDSGFNLSMLALTWEPLSFEENLLTVSVNFTFPLWVSHTN